MATNICSSCEIDAETVFDHRAGYKLCSRCGLVLEINLFDEIHESRNSQDSVENIDEIENPVCEIENPSTSTSGSHSNDQKIVTNSSKKGLKLLAVMAVGLGLTTGIKDRACEIYNEVDVLKTCRGRSMNSIVAACLFIACKEIGSSWTLNEISAVAHGVSKKNINRTAEAIKKQLEVEAWTVQRFCSKLGLENDAIKAVQEAVERTQELDIRRSPKSVLQPLFTW